MLWKVCYEISRVTLHVDVKAHTPCCLRRQREGGVGNTCSYSIGLFDIFTLQLHFVRHTICQKKVEIAFKRDIFNSLHLLHTHTQRKMLCRSWQLWHAFISFCWHVKNAHTWPALCLYLLQFYFAIRLHFAHASIAATKFFLLNSALISLVCVSMCCVCVCVACQLVAACYQLLPTQLKCI